MASKFPKGTIVHQVVQVLSGKVLSFSVDQESGDVQYCVEWVDPEGSIHSRYFRESELAADNTVETVGSPVEAEATVVPAV